MRYYPQTCPVCSGDMHDDVEDVGWVTCFVCARSFPASDVLAIRRLDQKPATAPVAPPAAA